MMKIEETVLEGLYVITPEMIEDNRGYFAELFRKDYFETLGADITFVQQNVSFSNKGVVRALHFQWDPPLGKLVRAVAGRIFAVGVDIRKKSPTLGKWFGVELSKDNRKSLYAPPGFAFGFCVLDDPADPVSGRPAGGVATTATGRSATSGAEVQYLYTVHRNANTESSFMWNDPTVGVKWPIENPILSEKDATAQTFKEWLARPESDLF